MAHLAPQSGSELRDVCCRLTPEVSPLTLPTGNPPGALAREEAGRVLVQEEVGGRSWGLGSTGSLQGPLGSSSETGGLWTHSLKVTELSRPRIMEE